MSDIIVESYGAVRLLRLNRPDKKNALTVAMYEALADALAAAETEGTVRAVAILGSGGTFCAGNDLKDFLANPPRPGDANAPVLRFLKALARATLPIVVGAEDVAVGIGFTLMLHCDAVLVSPDCRISAPFVDLALVPEAATTRLLPARIGHVRASELYMLGERIDGTRLVELGLANRTVDAGRLEEETLAMAARFAEKAPGAIRATKRLMRGDPAAIEAIIHEEIGYFLERLASPESREVMTAFLEKRPPDFSKIAG
ncbi:MAG: enoyl-CoA hydratase/isomerase family protein [Rhodobiaceae bacterium]|nr:enoyl-CoA hydratase/isomerase family protein [Rhodobiaceae bacterium]MCC0055762.1 enoyl-CoA hydratase/isomerase family protein [Rhodobiaceae bacterium]